MDTDERMCGDVETHNVELGSDACSETRHTNR